MTNVDEPRESGRRADAELRLILHVRPGSRVDRVGGNHDGTLVVRVRARAVDQAATRAALDLLADAFGVRATAIRLVRGATSRTKVVAVNGDVAALSARRDRLLAGPAPED
ncbi:MAG: DUF167 domain-containing protein [Acidimicrobiales bacterium]